MKIVGMAAIGVLLQAHGTFAQDVLTFDGQVSDQMRAEIGPLFTGFANQLGEHKTFTSSRDIGDGVFVTIADKQHETDIKLALNNLLQNTMALHPARFQIMKPARKPTEGTEDFIITYVPTGVSVHVVRTKRGTLTITIRCTL